MIKVVSFHGAQGGLEGRLAADLAPIITLGTATGGTDSTLIDDAQSWTEHQWEGHRLVIERDGVQTRHTVINSADAAVSFGPSLGDVVEATATIGAGAEGEGQIVVTLVGKGAGGNDWTLHLIAGTGDTGEDSATVDVEAQVITVVVDSDNDSNPRALMAGSLGAILHSQVPEQITSALEFTAGTLPLGTEAEPVIITFSGGADAPSVHAGDRYWLIRPALTAGELAALPEAGALTGDELVVAVQAGIVKRVTLATLKAYVDADPV